MGRSQIKTVGVVHNFADLMKLNLGDRINGVCALWEICPPSKSKHGPVVSKKFYNGLAAAGWKDCSDGAFKQAFRKGNIILKFMHLQTEDEYTGGGMDREWGIWRHSTGKKKKHLAACILYYQWSLLFQVRVPRRCARYYNCKTAARLASVFRISDWGFNHGHTKNNKTLFYDYDNTGSGWKAWKEKRLACQGRAW